MGSRGSVRRPVPRSDLVRTKRNLTEFPLVDGIHRLTVPRGSLSPLGWRETQPCHQIHLLRAALIMSKQWFRGKEEGMAINFTLAFCMFYSSGNTTTIRESRPWAHPRPCGFSEGSFSLWLCVYSCVLFLISCSSQSWWLVNEIAVNNSGATVKLKWTQDRNLKPARGRLKMARKECIRTALR